jgi:hypothetical protein
MSIELVNKRRSVLNSHPDGRWTQTRSDRKCFSYDVRAKADDHVLIGQCPAEVHSRDAPKAGYEDEDCEENI